MLLAILMLWIVVVPLVVVGLAVYARSRRRQAAARRQPETYERRAAVERDEAQAALALRDPHVSA